MPVHDCLTRVRSRASVSKRLHGAISMSFSHVLEDDLHACFHEGLGDT